MSLQDLTRDQRLQLMSFVCSFAWADLEVRDQEREFVHKLIHRLELDDEEKAEVLPMLKLPPPPEDVDPFDIPMEHRQVFLDACLQMIGVDGEVSEEEATNYNLLSQLLS